VPFAAEVRPPSLELLDQGIFGVALVAPTAISGVACSPHRKLTLSHTRRIGCARGILSIVSHTFGPVEARQRPGGVFTFSERQGRHLIQPGGQALRCL
jgi:hypothetical protein